MHILNILVQDGISVIQTTVKNIRDLIQYIGLSPTRLQIFNTLTIELRLKPQKILILDCSTR
jgi:hypothetical protein